MSVCQSSGRLWRDQVEFAVRASLQHTPLYNTSQDTGQSILPCVFSHFCWTDPDNLVKCITLSIPLFPHLAFLLNECAFSPSSCHSFQLTGPSAIASLWNIIPETKENLWNTKTFSEERQQHYKVWLIIQNCGEQGGIYMHLDMMFQQTSTMLVSRE